MISVPMPVGRIQSVAKETMSQGQRKGASRVLSEEKSIVLTCTCEPLNLRWLLLPDQRMMGTGAVRM